VIVTSQQIAAGKVLGIVPRIIQAKPDSCDKEALTIHHRKSRLMMKRQALKSTEELNQ